jgi:hypothetical protein
MPHIEKKSLGAIQILMRFTNLRVDGEHIELRFDQLYRNT